MSVQTWWSSVYFLSSSLHILSGSFADVYSRVGGMRLALEVDVDDIAVVADAPDLYAAVGPASLYLLELAGRRAFRDFLQTLPAMQV